MGARKKATRKKAGGRKSAEAMLISKARVKAAAKKCNVGSTFYDALDERVRAMIAEAEGRALANNRKTLRPQDV